MSYKIFPLGDSAVTIDFGNEISPEINDRVCALAEFCEQNQFAGFIETIPAYSSLTVVYDPVKVRSAFDKGKSGFETVKEWLENSLEKIENAPKNTRLVEIPVCYDLEFALDLEFVAAQNNLTIEQVIEIHSSRIYRVFMIGFLPGFAYLGEVDSRIAAPRKIEPRLKVPKGSVGIAGKQTGIYPFDSPGGWQIIGKTPLEMFDSKAEPPTFLKTGDSVRFYPITKSEFSEFTAK